MPSSLVFSKNEINLILRGSCTPLNKKMAALHEPFREQLSSDLGQSDGDNIEKVSIDSTVKNSVALWLEYSGIGSAYETSCTEKSFLTG